MKAKLISGKTGLVPHPEAECLCGATPTNGILGECTPAGESPTTY